MATVTVRVVTVKIEDALCGDGASLGGGNSLPLCLAFGRLRIPATKRATAAAEEQRMHRSRGSGESSW
jgi:hypothetical protein